MDKSDGYLTFERELTAGKGKLKWKWTDRYEKAFQEMKLIMVTDALLTYPDHNNHLKSTQTPVITKWFF